MWLLLSLVDYNECHTTGMCTHGHCINLDGGFKCVCDVGFMLAEGGEVCVGKLHRFNFSLATALSQARH